MLTAACSASSESLDCVSLIFTVTMGTMLTCMSTQNLPFVLQSLDKSQRRLSMLCLHDAKYSLFFLGVFSFPGFKGTENMRVIGLQA